MSKKKMKIKIFVVVAILILIIFGSIYLIDSYRMKNNEPVLFSTWGNEYENDNLKVALSLEDKINNDTLWCGTFNLIWNDLKNDIVKKDIEFTPQLDIVKNLNKGTFNTNYLSDESYYKVYGIPTLQLKNSIEKAIKNKFNETSDILDDFDWEDQDNKYFLYAMLKKQFEFPKEFTQLENGKFGNYENVKYFGIDSSSDKEIYNQVEILYYKSKDNFAIKLLTKSDDEIIITKGNNQNTFGKIYEYVQKQSENYDMDSKFTENDILKIPNIEFNLKEEFEQLENKSFLLSDGREFIIQTAMQTIQFELDKKGGKIKSEAGMMVQDNAVLGQTESRQFLVDNTFTIFLKEKNKDLPYFAAKISNIKNVQK